MSDIHEDLIDWLRQAPRTYGWGCLMAWDRELLNSLLLQNYITRFTGGSYLPAFTDTSITSDVTAELIYDYTLDYPRLSFENATINDSRARLRMKVVGGSQLSIEQHQDGTPRLAKVSAIDVLNGPTLRMNLAINRMPGTVSAGQLVLNIAQGGEFEMGFADTLEERQMGGDFFQKKFEALDEDKKIFVLGELGMPEGDVLKPVDFRVRTHGDPADPEGGALLLLIRMEGDGNGVEPPSDADLRYLLGNYSFAALLGRDRIMKRLFVPACKRIASSATPFVERIDSPPSGAEHYLYAAAGATQRFTVERTNTAYFRSVSVFDLMLPMASNSSVFRLVFKDSFIELEWTGEHLVNVTLHPNNWIPMNLQARITFTFKRLFKFNLTRPEGLLAIIRTDIGDVNRCEVRISTPDVDSSIVNAFANQVGKELDADLIARASTALELFSQTLQDIPIDQMTREVFGPRESLSLHWFSFTRDLAVFGNLAPMADVFIASPTELVIGPGQTHQFYTVPLLVPVRWTVENLAGESGPLGSISALGKYTAPTDLPGSYVRVKVTATGTVSGHISSALVTVLVNEISISPQVMVHSAGSSSGKEMRAGHRGTGSLHWEVANIDTEARIEPSTDPEGDHTYFPGPAVPGTSFSIDRIRVSNETSSALAYVLLTHHPLGVMVKSEPIGNGETVQLKGYNNGVEVPAGMKREWKVLLGAGSVDITSGVFTPGGDSPYLFAIVTLKVWLSDFVQADGYILLPVPYVDISGIEWKQPAT